MCECATVSTMAVRFSDAIKVMPEEENEDVDGDSDSSVSEFHKTITSSGSEAGNYASSDEDDDLLLELAVGGACTCGPSLYVK